MAKPVNYYYMVVQMGKVSMMKVSLQIRYVWQLS
ncbi:MAG: hypothetical protein JPMHGGIA_02292 [Saprospiraceae bacterium]|nr:hypothetical protein [Saprospiraceae bacterium]